MKKTHIYIGLSVLGLLIIGAYMAAPRGIRNNNPFNIRFNAANNWDGQTGQDGAGFAVFDSVHHGIRAGIKLIRNYQVLHGLNTVEQIITRFAPPVENDTQAYIDSVSKAIAMPSDAYLVLNNNAVAVGLAQAMIKHENGINPYPYGTIYKAALAAN